jgi:DNA topoisomerase-1
MYLVIVESPTKSRTIQQFLSGNYVVRSSFGHIRDLPKSDLGIDLSHDFEPHYVIPRKAQPHVKELKNELNKADGVILATDEDREGEAISWHLTQALGLRTSKDQKTSSKPAQRIVFHEITKSAIQAALKNPREIDMNLVDAQQARRVLDRLVGYKLSPFLWKKVARGLSAGRVQSVTVRLIVDREREVENFKSDEYWSVEAELRQRGNTQNLTRNNAETFTAFLYAVNGKVIPKLGIKSKEEADKILKDLDGLEYKIQSIEGKEMKRNPLPPFTTSTLQQEASKKFGMPSRATMAIAQALYEHGYITYHRTDSVNLSEQSLALAKQYIEKEFGAQYYSARAFKTKSKGAQEAHEAIRPTSAQKTPDSLNLDPRQKKAYNLIWRRFIASQMAQAVFDATTIDIAAANYTFRANGSILKFDGFLKVYPMKFEENKLPELSARDALELVKLIPSQHFTQPPARYSEATLIKELEKNGIGRPSTYAPTISTIQARNYVQKNEQKKFSPTEVGIAVNDILAEHFPQIVDIHFTAEMEEDLDKIAQGEKKWVPIVREFYEPFAKRLSQKYEEVQKQQISHEETDKICPKCGKNLIVRLGRFGKFLACTGFPECKHTEPILKKQAELGIKCPKCIEGDLVEKRTKRGKIFYACNRYPACDFALWDKPVRSAQGGPMGEKCEKCGSLLVEKNKKIVCSNKECEK